MKLELRSGSWQTDGVVVIRSCKRCNVLSALTVKITRCISRTNPIVVRRASVSP
jgi:hypothetical protein